MRTSTPSQRGGVLHRQGRRLQGRQGVSIAVADAAHLKATAAGVPAITEPGNKKAFTSESWQEARALFWKHRARLTVGLSFMLVSRLAGLIPPWSTKWLMDDVVAR